MILYYFSNINNLHSEHWFSLMLCTNIIIIIIMEKTEANLGGLCIREIDVKSQILVT